MADLLYINKNYPGTSQWDTDYKKMVLALRAAYRQGSTVKSIADVISAYTGETFYIEELFKLIGTPSIDETDRNSLKISVHAGGEALVYTEQNKGQLITEAYRLKALTDDLYHAIDLAKPAHVGINLTTIFGLDENIGAFVGPKDSAGRGILDELRIFVLMEEVEPGDPMLNLIRHNPLTPDTGLQSIYKTPFGIYYQWFRSFAGVVTELFGSVDPTLHLNYTETLVAPQDFNLSLDGARYYCVATLKDAAGTTMTHDGVSIITQTAAAQLRVRPYGSLDNVVPDPATPAPANKVSPYLWIQYPPSSVLAQQPDPNGVTTYGVTLQAIAEHKLPRPGLLSPRLNRVWEIKSDEFVGSDLE
jgi:hypothetical protein